MTDVELGFINSISAIPAERRTPVQVSYFSHLTAKAAREDMTRGERIKDEIVYSSNLIMSTPQALVAIIVLVVTLLIVALCA